MNRPGKKVLSLSLLFAALYVALALALMGDRIENMTALGLLLGIFAAEGVTVVPIVLKHQKVQGSRYVCGGTCGGSVTQQQYDAGAHTCGTAGCTHEGRPFTRIRGK